MSGGLLQMSGVVIDLVHRVDHLPAAGEEVETPDVLVTAGGGFNAMVAARRFGIDVGYGGSLGTGMFADIARRDLDKAGLRVLSQHRQAIDQGSCVVLVDRTGERSFVSRHGAERRLDAAEVDRLPVMDFDWILLTGYSLFKPESGRVFGPWLERLPRGPRLLFDPGPTIADIPPARLAPALARADWISANRREATILSGLADPAAAVRHLAKGREGAIVRTGAAGCWLASAEAEATAIPAFAVDAVDTNGAGDTHDGAFIAAACLGYDAAAAALLANAAAAMSTTRHGPATAPGLTETRSFIASRGVRLPEAGQRWRVAAGSGATGPS